MSSTFENIEHSQKKYQHEDVEQLANSRQSALDRIRLCGMVLSVCGFLCVPLGILLLVYIDFSEASFPVTSCIQVWAGIYMTALGVIAIYSSKIQIDLRGNIPDQLKGWLKTMSGMCSAGYSIGVMFIGWAIAAPFVCGFKMCGSNEDVILGVSIPPAVLSIFCFVALIFLHRAIFCNARIFQISFRGCWGRSSSCNA